MIVLTERNPFVVERLLHLLRRQNVGERESLALQQRPPHQVKRSLRATTVVSKTGAPPWPSLFAPPKEGLTEGES